jgi:hypothetical protein
MNYNTQLCNTAWGKVFVAHSNTFLFSTDVVGHTKTFGALAKEWQLECKTSFYQRTKKNVLVIENEISEMKQTKM